MRTALKVAATLGAVALGVAAPVTFVVHGAGAPGRADSPGLWWERLRRLPEPVLLPPGRASAVRAGETPVEVLKLEAQPLEARGVPSNSPVVAIAERDDLVAVATFDDGAFVVEPDGTVHRVEGVAAVNALAFDGLGNLCIASDDGAFVVEPDGRVDRAATGPYSAVAWIDGIGTSGTGLWFASRGGLALHYGHTLFRWGAEQGVYAEQPTSLAQCGEAGICLGGVDGLRKLRISVVGDTTKVLHLSHQEAAEEPDLPAQFVTAVASSPDATWVGTFDGGLVRIGAAPLTPADGLPEGRINPRALAVAGDQAFAGTPSGLLVAKGRRAALVPVGGAVSAVARSAHGGVWLGLSGKVVRVAVEFPGEQAALAQSRIQ